jgi:hypothetical protein
MAFLRRLLFAPIVLVVVAAVTYVRGHAQGLPFDQRAVAEGVVVGRMAACRRRRARGGRRHPVPDFALLCALGLWGAVLLIVLGLIADGIVSLFDPRVRMSASRAW